MNPPIGPSESPQAPPPDPAPGPPRSPLHHVDHARHAHHIRPYLPALVTIAVVVILAVVFQRPIANWFAGRPVFDGAASSTQTLDAGAFRVGAVVRPATPFPGDNDLFIGVGNRLGTLRPKAFVTAEVNGEPVPVELGGDGQFKVTVTLPESGPVPVHLHIVDPELGDGHTTAILEARRNGVAREGAVDGVAFYTCPMHPSIRAPAMSTCPICAMDLVAVTHEEITTGTVRIDARRRQLIGVTTATLAARPLTITVRSTGIATWDETRLIDVTARADGWVEELFADFTGKPVKAGDPLAAIYVPEIRAAQLELIAAARGHRAAAGTLLETSSNELHQAARDKLRLLGVSDDDLRRVLRTGRPEAAITLVAPADGLVAEKMVKRGSPVMANQPILRLASLDPIWVLVHVYEQDMALVHPGLEALVSFPYLTGEPRRGTVTFIEPSLDEGTRTVQVRIVLPNADGEVRPGMFAEARLTVTLPDRLVIPHEAVVFAGPRKLVFVDEGGGRMRPVEVELGARGDDGYEVRKGVVAGLRVVTSGNFLIGAESRLRSAVGAW